MLSLRVSWSPQKPLPPRWPRCSPFLTGEGPTLQISHSFPACSLAGRVKFYEQKTLLFSKLLLAGRPTSSWSLPLRQPSLPSPFSVRDGGGWRVVGVRQGGVGVCHSSQGGDLGTAPSLMVWASFKDALNARFVSPLLKVGCCQAGHTLPLWQGTSTFLPLCCSFWAWIRA